MHLMNTAGLVAKAADISVDRRKNGVTLGTNCVTCQRERSDQEITTSACPRDCSSGHDEMTP
jgi:hypothetical protein